MSQTPEEFQWACEEQAEFFERGPSPTLASGGYGCVGPDTKIFNIETNSYETVNILVKENRAPIVLAWDGKKFNTIRASVPFKKGKDNLYRVTTAKGNSIVITKNHYFLTQSDGWKRFEDFLTLSPSFWPSLFLLGCDVSLPLSNSELYQLTHVSNDLHWFERVLDSHRDCLHCPHSYDELLREAQDNALNVFPSQDDVLKHSHGDCHFEVLHEGVLKEQLQEYTHLDQLYDLPSNLHSVLRTSPHEELALCLNSSKYGELALLRQVASVFSVSEQNQSQLHLTSLYHLNKASKSNELASSLSCLDYITKVEDLGVGDYYDLNVPIFHNYLAEGLIHHNSGKTMVGLLKLLYLMDTFPGYRVCVIRRRITDLKKTTLSTLWKLLPESAYNRGKRNDQEGTLILNNGSRFDFIYLDKPEASIVLRGLEINAFLLDQAEEMREEVFDILMTRLGRWDKAKIPPEMIKSYTDNGKSWPWTNDAGTILAPSYALLTANPDNELHWLWRRFHPQSKDWRNKWRFRGYKLINFQSTKNRFLGKQNLEEMMSKGEDFVNRYVLGVWGRPEGTLFDIDPQSIIEATPDILNRIKTEFSLFRVLDHGFSAPTCVGWFATDRKGNAIAYREYYHKSDQIRVHRENITALSENETYTNNIADSEIFNKMPTAGGGRFRVADEYADTKLQPVNTALWWGRADKNEMASRSRLKEYLYVDPEHDNPFTGEKGAPRLYFIKKSSEYPHGCDHIINEIKAAKLLKVGTIDGKPIFSDERDPEIADHGLDVTRYFVMSRPSMPAIKNKPSSSKTFDGYSKLAKDARKKEDALRSLYR